MREQRMTCIEINISEDFKNKVIGYIDGIKISEPTENTISRDGLIQIHVKYIPNFVLPGKIRFALEGKDYDIAEPFNLNSYSELRKFLPEEKLEILSVKISEGKLLFSSENKTNGNMKLQPELICIVNNSVIRNGILQKLNLSPEGSCYSTYQFPIIPEDLKDEGIVFDIFLASNLKKIATKTLFQLKDTPEFSSKLVFLETKLESLQKRIMMVENKSKQSAEAETARNSKLIDSFFEYTTSFLFNSLNKNTSKDKKDEKFLREFRQLAEKVNKVNMGSGKQGFIILPLSSLLFEFGWFDYKKGDFEQVWMGKSAGFYNPEPSRKIVKITLIGRIIAQLLNFSLVGILDGDREEFDVSGAGPLKTATLDLGDNKREVSFIHLFSSQTYMVKDANIKERSLSVTMIKIEYEQDKHI